MRIGQVARILGVSADTVRFYERSGWMPSAARLANGYREYGDADVEHLRLLIDLRSLEIPLERAAEVATMCHSGHCADTTRELPGLIARQREEISQRIERLQLLDGRLADLSRHLAAQSNDLPMIAIGACCDAAGAVLNVAGGRCACCAEQA
jgi:DNA-binding transcriptional MerR regulator